MNNVPYACSQANMESLGLGISLSLGLIGVGRPQLLKTTLLKTTSISQGAPLHIKVFCHKTFYSSCVVCSCSATYPVIMCLPDSQVNWGVS